MDSDKEKSLRESANWQPIAQFLIIASIAVIVIMYCAWHLLRFYFNYYQEHRNFGEILDLVNAFIAGIAFAGIIYTIALQSNELALQRQELEETRKELKRTADAQEKSEKSLEEQVEAIRLQTEAIYRPYIVVRLEVDRVRATPALFLTTRNNGQTTAENLEVEITEGNLELLSGKYLFQNVITSFPPGSRYDYLVGTSSQVNNAITNNRLSQIVKLTTRYSYSGKEVQEITTLDFKSFADVHLPSE